MKWLFASFAVLAVSPVASAQARCAIYERLIAAGPEEFAPLKDSRPTQGLPRSTLAMPGVGPCQIAQEPETSVLACFSSALDSQTARARYAAALELARGCLAAWTASEPGPQPGAGDLVEGVRFTGVGPHAGGEVVIALTRVTSSNLYAVTGGLAWSRKAQQGD